MRFFPTFRLFPTLRLSDSTALSETLKKFWHLELLGWDLLCNLTLKSFSSHKNTLYLLHYTMLQLHRFDFFTWWALHSMRTLTLFIVRFVGYGRSVTETLCWFLIQVVCLKYELFISQFITAFDQWKEMNCIVDDKLLEHSRLWSEAL